MGKKKVVTWATGIFLIFIISLITHLPASLAVRFLSLPQGIAIAGPKGTVWNGNLHQVIWKSTSLGSVSWQVHPFQLFMGQLAATIHFGKYSELHIQGRGEAGVSLSGAPYLHGFRFTIPAQMLAELAPLPLPATAEGLVKISVSDYRYREPFCETADVHLDWSNAQISLMNQMLPLEKVTSGFKCDNNRITVKGNQRSQVLMSEYSVDIDVNRKYQLHGWLQPAPGFPESLEKMLRMGIHPDDQGRYTFRFNGQL